MINLRTPEINFAIQAVSQASILVQQIQKGLVSPALTKDDHSPTTIGDLASQALIGYLLNERFPNDNLVAEEDSKILRRLDNIDKLEKVTEFVKVFIPHANPRSVCDWIDHGGANPSSRFWTLDPIDGTSGFLRSRQYAIALALIVNGEVQIGVLGCPMLANGYLSNSNGTGSLLVAVRNQGTWITNLDVSGSFEHLSVSSQTNTAQARLLHSFEKNRFNTEQIKKFAKEFGIQAEPIRMDSQAKYAVLAAGKAELLLRLLMPSEPDYQERIWDQAAGSIILEEAGGRITDLDGKSLDFRVGRTLAHNRGVLASNGILHKPALRALRAISA
jgi:3'(2'), 5'-bisphosphate nucleotidase